ncbi:hypothetical protein KCP76_13915 [Salmonella enterica subsp. enterica serovar Weltevreden]|nr:hypothetical protein KCP76_13915 [Salmonella enterica subsp. enterica serovar Weltevreden]
MKIVSSYRTARRCRLSVAGAPTDGLMGGGFLYTDETTLSLGCFGLRSSSSERREKIRSRVLEVSNSDRQLALIFGGKLIGICRARCTRGGMNMQQPELVGVVLIAGMLPRY